MEDDFAKFAETVVLFCHITSHVEGDKDPELLSEKGGGGFPYLVFMDGDGNVLLEHEGDRSAEGFAKTKEGLDVYFKAKAAAAKGDKAAAIDVILAELDFGILTKDAGESKLKGLKLTADQEKRRAEVMYNLEVKEMTNGFAIGKKFYDDFKAGKKPTKDDLVQPFYQQIMTYGELAKKADAFEAGLNGMKANFEKTGISSNPNVMKWIEGREAVLKKLQGK